MEKKPPLKPITAGPLPEAVNPDKKKQLPELPTYHPPP
jgi:hypothetical protein